MLNFKYHLTPSITEKVIFDTNAYRNFATKYLSKNSELNKTIERLKDCESNHSIVPSTNPLTIMELYKHLIEGDTAKEECEKAIIFSFKRSILNGNLQHQPLPEIEISSRLFDKIADYDMNINEYFFNGHINFCNNHEGTEFSKDEFIAKVDEQIKLYKQSSFSALMNNIQRLFPDFDFNTFKFSKKSHKVFKTKYGNQKEDLFNQLSITLYEAFKSRLNIEHDPENRSDLIEQIKSDYKVALLSYIKYFEKLSKNKPKNKTPFKLNENDLIDSFILFSIVPEENIILVTDENKIHEIFKEAGHEKFVFTLEDYLSKIKFINHNT